MAGFGLAPYGLSPYGGGTPDPAPIPGGSLFREAGLGANHGSRKINAVTHDYEADEFGRFAGMSDAQQEMLLAMGTDLGTSAVKDMGNRLRAIQEIDDDLERQIQEHVRAATARGVAAGRFKDVTAKVTREGSRVFTRVTWRDPKTNEKRNVDLP